MSYAADKGRVAKLLLAVLDDDTATINAVLEEANAADGGLQGLIATLAAGTLELLTGAVGKDGARKTLGMTALDASLDGYETRPPHTPEGTSE